MTKGQQTFLSTLAKDGEAQFVTALKPCGILLPHVHQRANEFYSVVSGAPPLLRLAAVGFARRVPHVPVCATAARTTQPCGR